MIFSSYAFILGFFPVVFVGFRLIGRLFGGKPAKLWLVGASLFFYAYGEPRLVLLLGGTMLFNYAVVRGLDGAEARGTRAKLLLAAALVEGLGILFYFKYTNFFLENINRVLGTAIPLIDVILPLGISFYTFQILAYVVEVYRGNSRRSNLLDYAVFVTFFPQLIVGPIIRHDEMVPQLEGERLCRVDREKVMLGILLFAIGCGKKILLADPMISHAQDFYSGLDGGTFFEAWGGVISYTFAYYFDFSGYIDMALGLGLLFGVRLPVNFNSPYKARNFADFWRRWNITVSGFFNDYVFKNIFHFGDRTGKLILATLATFLVSGIWHGAGWHFIFWGLANGVLVSMANLMTLKRKKLPFPLAWAMTFFVMMLTRVLFDSGSMSQALAVYKSLFDIRPYLQGGFITEAVAYLGDNLSIACTVLVGAGICFFAPNTGQIAQSFKPKWYHAAASGGLLAASLFFMGRVSSFLYFQF